MIHKRIVNKISLSDFSNIYLVFNLLQFSLASLSVVERCYYSSEEQMIS